MTDETALLHKAIKLMRESVSQLNEELGTKFAIQWGVDKGYTKYRNQQLNNLVFPVVVAIPHGEFDDALFFHRRDLDDYVAGNCRKVDEALQSHLRRLAQKASK